MLLSSPMLQQMAPQPQARPQQVGFAEVAWEVAKPPWAADLMCVAALSLGLNFDISFGRVILDILTPEHFSTRDPDAFHLRLLYIFQPRLSL